MAGDGHGKRGEPAPADTLVLEVGQQRDSLP